MELIAKHSIYSEFMQKNVEEFETNSSNRHLCEKYFKLWKNVVEAKIEQKRNKELIKRQRKKLNTFLTKVKKHKANLKTKHKTDEEFSKKCKKYVPISPESNRSYENSFKAQKTIIEMQKTRLEEQNRIIQDLKLGIMTEDLEKSIAKSKMNIREIFTNCSTETKIKIPILLVEEPKISISTQKAPKILQEMQEKAVKRAENRQQILERKRLIEEMRQKMVTQAIENKKTLDEEKKTHILDMIKETRRKQLEMQQIRQTNKRIFLEKWNRSVEFYNKRLITICFRKLYGNLERCQGNDCLAVHHYTNTLLKKCLNAWIVLVEDSYKIKTDIADEHFKYKTLKRSFAILCELRLESVRNMQVAEDIYDFRLTSNVFIHWNRYACLQFMQQQTKIKKADKHYGRWLLFRSFYQWKSLKIVVQLEKAKELKKERWRQKVWEVLPDYQPPKDW